MKFPKIKKHHCKKVLFFCCRAILIAILTFYILYLIFPFPEEKLQRLKRRRQSTLILDRHRNPLRAFRGNSDSWTFWRRYEDVNPLIIQGIIAAEDSRFHYHPGVDPLSLLRAIYQNIRYCRRISGASTLTMQLMRILNPKPRTVRSKLQEAFRALQFEHSHSKTEILEWYLNLAPFGSNFYGIEAASLFYFGKSSEHLNLAEAALLAGIPQSPSRLRPDRFKDAVWQRRKFVLQRMADLGFISYQQAKVASEEPIATTIHKLPFKAPHFCRMASQASSGSVLISTLDPYCQYHVENILKNQISNLNGVHNGAVVIIENQTSKIRAFVGNRNFFDQKHAGQMNAATTKRSAGSTLKPFLYALAFEQHLCLPETKLPDSPHSYSGYIPVNFDYSYRGPVSAAEALSKSYNAPAVYLLHKLGSQTLCSHLQRCGIRSIRHDSAYYGLPLILGGAEVSLLELTNAYTVFSRHGKYQPAKYLESKKTSSNRQVFSPDSVSMLVDILKNETGLHHSANGARIQMAWKTGTSYGFRDAWTIAFTPEYTVGVWLGNLNSESSRNLIGLKAATPIAQQVLSAICKHGDGFAYQQPANNCKICKISGKRAGPYCSKQQSVRCLPGSFKLPTCDIHYAKHIKVTDKHGISSYQQKVYESWPAAFAVPRKTLTNMSSTQDQPQLLSPEPNQTYYTMTGKDHFQKLQLKAVAANESLFWYIDGHFVCKTASFQPAFRQLANGRHRITCSTKSGQSKSITICVKPISEKR